MTRPIAETGPQATTPAPEPPVQQPAAGDKAIYAPPKLKTFGTIAEITATVGRHGRRDGRRSNRRTGY
ncbi:MAG: hypothetical protein WBQ26_10510 [Gemmatimonadaceae bacterium]|nr:hypothetical protein [Gemmatimonadaceae bacterium]